MARSNKIEEPKGRAARHRGGHWRLGRRHPGTTRIKAVQMAELSRDAIAAVQPAIDKLEHELMLAALLAAMTGRARGVAGGGEPGPWSLKEGKHRRRDRAPNSLGRSSGQRCPVAGTAFGLLSYAIDALDLPEHVAPQMKAQHGCAVPRGLHVVFNLIGGDGLLTSRTLRP
jgi:hypothetical protein